MGIGTRPFKATIHRVDVRTSPSGKTYVKCKLRTSRKDRKTDEWIGEFWDATLFTDATLYDKDRITVEEFTLEQRQYEFDGQKRTAYDMTVWKFTQSDAPKQPAQPPITKDTFAPVGDPDDELQF